MKIRDFKDIPLFPRACWEADFAWRDLEASLKRYQEDETLPLDLNPDYQRNRRWTREQQIAYVEYVLQGGEHGRVLVFSCSGWSKVAVGPFQLVDGKQRLTAVLGFLRGTVPAFGLTRDQFCGEIRNHASFAFRILDLPDRVAVLRYYLALNAGGTPHSPEELQKVRDLLQQELQRAPNPRKRKNSP